MDERDVCGDMFKVSLMMKDGGNGKVAGDSSWTVAHSTSAVVLQVI